MKDFNYKGHVLNIEELSKFHLSNIYDGNRYRGTSIINDKKQIKETSTIEILINWFKI